MQKSEKECSKTLQNIKCQGVLGRRHDKQLIIGDKSDIQGRTKAAKQQSQRVPHFVKFYDSQINVKFQVAV